MIIHLNKEHQLNKILKTQSKEKTSINLLFISEWDEHGNIFLDKLHREDLTLDAPVYLIDSFQMPHLIVTGKQ